MHRGFGEGRGQDGEKGTASWRVCVCAPVPAPAPAPASVRRCTSSRLCAVCVCISVSLWAGVRVSLARTVLGPDLARRQRLTWGLLPFPTLSYPTLPYPTLRSAATRQNSTHRPQCRPRTPCLRPSTPLAADDGHTSSRFRHGHAEGLKTYKDAATGAATRGLCTSEVQRGGGNGAATGQQGQQVQRFTRGASQGSKQRFLGPKE